MLQPYQTRVIDENTELVSKIESLEGFIGSPRYHALDHANQFLLRKQLLAMREYLDILAARIALFMTPEKRHE